MMKRYFYIISILLFLSGCYKETERIGYLSDHIYLKGADTLELALGSKGVTDIAWLDGSSEPCNFSIENIRDENGQSSEQFFEELPLRKWIKPYVFEEDTTMELIMSKIEETNSKCFSINPVNGQLQFFQTTSNLEQPGDVFHVDVKVNNSWGEKVYEDYAVMKLVSDYKPYKFYRATTAIILLNEGGEKTFTLYDYISEQDLDRHESIYNRDGKELIDIYKKADEPSQGVKILIQYKDSEGKIFDSKDYATYAAGTQSYLDYSVNRQNTPEGALVEFPMTPFPANEGLLSYLKGATLDYSVLDTAALHTGVYYNQEYPKLYDWPADEWGASKWYIRLRSKIVFNEPGTWVISVTFPYTHIDKTFD